MSRVRDGDRMRALLIALSKLRMERRITQARLAAVLGVATSTLAHWESGKYRPTLAQADAYAAAVGASLDIKIITGLPSPQDQHPTRSAP